MSLSDDNTRDALAAVGAAAAVFGVTKLSPPHDEVWYRSLKKPKWTPPNFVFPLVWIPLKIAQTAALFLVLRRNGSVNKSQLALPLAAFGAHLFLGHWWNVKFFGQHKLKESLKWMATFYASIGATAITFHAINPVAGALILPTQLWVTIAAALNYSIVELNGEPKAAGSCCGGH